MSSRALVTALNVGWAFARRAATRRFHEAAKAPRAAQDAWLREFLHANAHTAYGRAHGYAKVASTAGFQERVPVVGWDELRPWVDRIEQGEAQVLTGEPVRVLERTSGGAAGPKLIPYTEGLLADFGAAVSPWLDDVFRAFPRLMTLRQYWSLSPVARAPAVTAGGVRVGLEDDTEYFDVTTRLALKRLFCVDGFVARMTDVEAWRTKTLTQLVAAEDLGFVSVWNPAFFTLLLEALEARWPEFEAGLPAGRREAVSRRLSEAGRFVAEAVWPSLQLVSCWTDAWAAQALPALRRYLPATPLQGKGLLATEGVVTLPLWGQSAPVAAVASHFLEFEALEDEGQPVRCLHELSEGARYAPVITTRGGFARYRLPDVVRCVGHFQATPLLRFEGRLDRTSDLRGEKLSAVVAEGALRDAAPDAAFALLAPELGEPPGYLLFLEGVADPDAAARRVEAALLREHHYRYCRELGQLGPVRAVPVKDGARRYVAAMLRRGLELGDVKPAGFDPQPGWRDAFVLGAAGHGRSMEAEGP